MAHLQPVVDSKYVYQNCYMDVVTIQACRLLFFWEADAMVNFSNTKSKLILCEQFDLNVPTTC